MKAILFLSSFLVTLTTAHADPLFDAVHGLGQYEDHVLTGQSADPLACVQDLGLKIARLALAADAALTSPVQSSSFSANKSWIGVTANGGDYTVTMRVRQYGDSCYIDTSYHYPLYIEDANGTVVREVEGPGPLEQGLDPLFSGAGGLGNPALP
jgi:hypothetical protein